MEGKSGREAFGEITFKGLVQNRPLKELTHQDIYKAFINTPYKLTNHTIMRLKDIRTYNLGVKTLNDFAKHLNKGVILYESGTTIAIQYGKFEAIIDATTKYIITFKPL